MPFRSPVLIVALAMGCTSVENPIRERENIAPLATINAPIGDTVFDFGEAIDFIGVVADEDGAGAAGPLRGDQHRIQRAVPG